MIRWLPFTLLVACVDDVTLARWPDAGAPPDTAPSPDAPAVPDALDAPDVLDVSDASDAPPVSAPYLVQAVVSALPTGEGGRSWLSAVTVLLSNEGGSVSGAQVSLTSSTGAIPLMAMGMGRYQGSQVGFGGAYTLTVTPPTGAPQVGRWTSIAPHTITSPRPDDFISPIMPLTILWVPTGAMEAQVVSPEGLPVMADMGTATVDAARLPVGARDVTIRVRRRSTEMLGSFAPGSYARMEVTAAVLVHER